MPRTLTILLPDGRVEYWLTALVFEPGDPLRYNGEMWIVTSVGNPESNGKQRHTTVTVRPRKDADA